MKNFFLHFAFELQRRRQAPSDVVQHQPKWKKLIKKKANKNDYNQVSCQRDFSYTQGI